MEREEAINLIKQVLPCLNIDEKIREGFETLIPELKESEDERVRKALIDGIRQIRCKNSVTQEQMLAYLEKQKEQKHPDGCFTCDEYKKGYEEGRRNGFTAGYNKAMKEVEQKGQKPECDNETEVQKAYREGKNAGRKEVLDHPEYYGLQLRRMYDYETGERNPEWSEEDKTHLCWIIECFDSWKYQVPEFADQYQSAIDWLKALRPRHITYALDAPLCYDNDMNPIYPPINHWKPSDVQMEALAWYSGNSGIPPTGDKAIKSLYNDLKKL